MAEWEVWRQDDNGQRFLVVTWPDRVEALARVLVFESGRAHQQTYDVRGPKEPVVVTNRDLYLRLAELGEHLVASGRALLDYLCSLWTVTRHLAGREVLDGDLFTAALTAAASAEPVRPDPAWRVDDFTVEAATEAYRDFGDFTKVLCTQIADLLAFEENPPGPLASLGVDAPPRIDGGRATIPFWSNFDPSTFLEGAAAGAFGGWSAADGRRVCTGEPSAAQGRRASSGEPSERGSAGEEVSKLEPISWGDFAAFLEYGQSYE